MLLTPVSLAAGIFEADWRVEGLRRLAFKSLDNYRDRLYKSLDNYRDLGVISLCMYASRNVGFRCGCARCSSGIVLGTAVDLVSTVPINKGR